MDWWNQYCENGCYCEKQSMCLVPHQNSNDIHHRDRKINPKVHFEPQKTYQIAKVILNKERAMLEVSQYLTSNYNTEL
jgi:hypothetical protein